MMQDSDEQLNLDFEFARKTQIENMTKGEEALDCMMDLAQQLQHPKAWEVVNAILKTNGDNAKLLIDLHKSRKSVNKPAFIPFKNQTQIENLDNDKVFVGTTQDLQRLIQEEQMKRMVDITDASDSG